MSTKTQKALEEKFDILSEGIEMLLEMFVDN